MKLHDEQWMTLALREANKACKKDEVPVGAVLVKEGEVIARGYNVRESRQNPSGHAELIAIQRAANKLKNWRLLNTTLYVTLEPCTMCWGAIVLARIARVVFGTVDLKAGVCGSVASLHEAKFFNHHPKVVGGVKAAECAQMLSDFFKKLRKSKK